MPACAERLRRLAFLLLMVTAAPEAAETGVRPGLDVGTVLGGDAADGFARALEPRVFRFPEDHGPHPDYRSEWWYVTAHADTPDGVVGVQFTLFRQALAPPAPSGADGGSVRTAESAWRTRQVYMGHLAVTVPGVGHLADERLSRDALGLAGASARPLRVWLDDWVLESLEPGRTWPARLQARAAGGIEVDLVLEPRRDPILQGDRGLSRKSATPGNASYYYSYTRMGVRGRVAVDQRESAFDGLGWMDREWSTSALEAGQSGWDWIALHLADGRDLMIYRLRLEDGGIDAASEGVLVTPDGLARRLPRATWSLTPQRTWTDEQGVAWPVSWALEVPSAGIRGTLEAVRDDQLNRLSVRYWEGVVELRGSVSGRGFLETTGY